MSESSSLSDAWLPVQLYESSVSSSLCEECWEGSGVEERVTVDFRDSLILEKVKKEVAEI